MKRKRDEVLKLDLTDLIDKVAPARHEKEQPRETRAKRTALSDQVRNYDPATDSIECPVLLESVPIDEAIVATCCWNGFSAHAFSQIYHTTRACPLCRRVMLRHYMTLETFDFLPESKRLGIDLEWPLCDLFEAIEHETKALVVELISPSGASLFYGEPRTVKESGFHNASLAHVFLAIVGNKDR
jgi:hypothetical protein